MTSTDYDFGSLSRAQLDALSSIAFGGSSRTVHIRTLKALEQRGLLESSRSVDRVGFPPVVVTDHIVPLPVHIAFCAWCETQR